MASINGIWAGPPPSVCEISGLKITDQFVDGRVAGVGRWALMHPTTHAACGVGFGPGRAQRFARQPDGTFVKVEG